MRTTATIGIGLIAMPTAAGRKSPIAWPTGLSFRQVVDRRLHGRAARRRRFACAEPNQIAHHAYVSDEGALDVGLSTCSTRSPSAAWSSGWPGVHAQSLDLLRRARSTERMRVELTIDAALA
jgi:hypothetical protein